MSISRRMDKDKVGCVCHTTSLPPSLYMEYHAVTKRVELAICRNMDGPRGY